WSRASAAASRRLDGRESSADTRSHRTRRESPARLWGRPNDLRPSPLAAACPVGVASPDLHRTSFAHRFERREDAIGAGIDADRRAVAPADDAVAIEDEECALAMAFLVTVRAVRLGDCSLRIEGPRPRGVKIAI